METKKEPAPVAIKVFELAEMAKKMPKGALKQWVERVAANNPPGQTVLVPKAQLERCRSHGTRHHNRSETGEDRKREARSDIGQSESQVNVQVAGVDSQGVETEATPPSEQE